MSNDVQASRARPALGAALLLFGFWLLATLGLF